MEQHHGLANAQGVESGNTLVQKKEEERITKEKIYPNTIPPP